MSLNQSGQRQCDGCGRVFDSNLMPAERGERDFCGTCAHNRQGRFEVERGDRRLMSHEVEQA